MLYIFRNIQLYIRIKFSITEMRTVFITVEESALITGVLFVNIVINDGGNVPS